MKNFLKFGSGDGASGEGKGDWTSDEYYRREEQCHKPFRIVGLVSSIFAISFNLVAILSRQWIKVKAEDVGLWDTRYSNWSFNRQENGEPHTHNPHWQSVVIGLLIFAVTFGFLATILTVCGVCVSPLYKKIYYYHSAGEIYFICALATAGALIVFPVAIDVDTSLGSSLQWGWAIGWVGTFLFFVAAFCMTLDDIIRKTARGCCKGDSNSANRV